MTAPVFGPAEIQRDNWGRPLVLLPDLSERVPYTRCTTYVGPLEDQFALGKWQQRKVAEGLATRPDLLLWVNSLGPEPPHREADALDRWKKAMDTACEDAIEAARAHAAATIGSALHKLTERIDRGEDVGRVPEQYRPHMVAYLAATAHLHPVHIEQFSVLDELRIGGTPDRVVTIDGEDGLFIADIKTGTLNFGVGKMCMQLAVYAHSVPYDPATDQRHPYTQPVHQDRGLIIGLSGETGLVELRWVDLAAGWEAVQLATQVRAWRSRKALSRLASQVIAVPPVEVPVPVPELPPAAEAALLVAIDQATSTDELVELWRAAQVRGVWTVEHTARAAARKAVLLRAA